jgi:hypothetical protein
LHLKSVVTSDSVREYELETDKGADSRPLIVNSRGRGGGVVCKKLGPKEDGDHEREGHKD